MSGSNMRNRHRLLSEYLSKKKNYSAFWAAYDPYKSVAADRAHNSTVFRKHFFGLLWDLKTWRFVKLSTSIFFPMTKLFLSGRGKKRFFWTPKVLLEILSEVKLTLGFRFYFKLIFFCCFFFSPIGILVVLTVNETERLNCLSWRGKTVTSPDFGAI